MGRPSGRLSANAVPAARLASRTLARKPQRRYSPLIVNWCFLRTPDVCQRPWQPASLRPRAAGNAKPDREAAVSLTRATGGGSYSGPLTDRPTVAANVREKLRCLRALDEPVANQLLTRRRIDHVGWVTMSDDGVGGDDGERCDDA